MAFRHAVLRAALQQLLEDRRRQQAAPEPLVRVRVNRPTRDR